MASQTRMSAVHRTFFRVRTPSSELVQATVSPLHRSTPGITVRMVRSRIRRFPVSFAKHFSIRSPFSSPEQAHSFCASSLGTSARMPETSGSASSAPLRDACSTISRSCCAERPQA